MTIIKTQNYDIKFTQNVFEEINELRKDYDQVIFISDHTVEDLYLNEIEDNCISIEPGEESKTLTDVESIYNILLTLQASRKTLLVGFGGGIVCDITGFVAGTYMRGIDFINVPTTLLSMVDSSVGGKVGVNLHGHKNYIGLFNNPKKVLINKDFINTLEEQDIRNGIAEMLKIFMLFDKQSFDKLMVEDYRNLIENAIELKVSVVDTDYKENSLRRLLNLGHTIAHAIETHSSHMINHGDAVAIGIYTQLSDKLRKEVDPIYDKYNLPRVYANLEQALDLIITDKKVEGEYIYEPEVSSIGNSEVKKIKLINFKDGLNV